MSSIRLHKKKGVNPKLTFCVRCGGKAEEIILLGANDGKYECSTCGMISFGHQPQGRCPRCKQDYLMTRIGNVDEHEKLPAYEYCDDCIKEIKDHKEIVAKGGVYWKCSKCNNSGVIKVSAPLAAQVRKQHKIDPPGECGIDFEGTYLCPVCHPQGNK